MSIRSILSSIATGAVLLGLTGISSPAFAAAPTVTIDLAGSGCESTTELLINGLDPAEYFGSMWEDGSAVEISTTATCDGTDYGVRWEQIALPDGGAIVLTVPDMSGVNFVSMDGTVDSAWGADCVNTDYLVGAEISMAISEWGSTSKPNVSYVASEALESDATFSLVLPEGYSIWPQYPMFNYVTQEYTGAPDSESGEAFYEKCQARPVNQEVVGTAGGSIDLVNKTARFVHTIDYPVGFDSSACSVESTEYEFLWRGIDSTSLRLTCGGYAITLEEAISGVTRGTTTEVTYAVPALEMVTISGEVEFAHAICTEMSFSIYNSTAGWDWEVDAGSGDPQLISDTGEFELTVPKGNVTLNANSMESSDSIDSEFLNSACSITDGNLGYVGQDLTNLVVHADNLAIDVAIEQPVVNDSGETCSLFDPYELESPYAANPENRSFGVRRGATEVVVGVYCGSDFQRTLAAPFTMSSADQGSATLQVPDLKMKTVTGSFKLPASYPANRYRDLSLAVQPYYDHENGAQGGWQQMSTYDATIQASKGKYTVTLPEGAYTFGVRSQATPKKGCYVDSFYPATTVQFAQPVNISSSTARAPEVKLLVGGRIQGHASFTEDVTSDVSWLEDQVFNTDGVSFAWFAGDGTVVEDDGDFHVYQCLPPGDYFYRAGQSNAGIKSEFYDNVTSMANAKPITIPAGGGDSKVFEMEFDAFDDGKINGTVVDESNNPLVGYQVVAYDPDTESFRTAETDSDGNYSITGLDLPGSYEVFAFGSGFWYGGTSTDYAFFPSTNQAGAVKINITNSRSTRDDIGLIVDGSQTAASFVDLYPWYRNMSIQAPADNFDGVADAVESGDIALDEANVQIVPDNRQRTGAPLADWELDLDVNFNSILDSTVGAYGFSNGAAAAELGEVGAVEDVAHIRGEMDLNEGLNFVTVTGSESGDSVAVPIVFGALAPTQLTDPEMSGVLKVGKTVKSTAGFWLASPSITKKSYQWMTCSSSSTVTGCKAIAGQKALKIKLPATAKRKYLALKVTSTNGTTSTVEVHSFGRVQ